MAAPASGAVYVASRRATGTASGEQQKPCCARQWLVHARDQHHEVRRRGRQPPRGGGGWGDVHDAKNGPVVGGRDKS